MVSRKKGKRKASAGAAAMDTDAGGGPAQQNNPAAGGWFTGAGAAVLTSTTEETAMVACDPVALEQSVNWKVLPRDAHLKVRVGAINKASSRGQRTKAQKLRKIERLEKALASSDKYMGKCAKAQRNKQQKAELANLY